MTRLITVGSLNPVKVKAVEKAAKHYWNDIEIKGVVVDSGITAMPMSKQEVKRGARIRAISAQKTANSWIGVGNEGGVCKIDGDWYLFGTTFATDGKMNAWGGETLVKLPYRIVDELNDGLIELGTVIDRITGQQNTKQSFGAVSVLTNGALKRIQIFELSALMALSSWLNLFNE